MGPKVQVSRVLLNAIGVRLLEEPEVDFQREPPEREHCPECGVGLLPAGICPRCQEPLLREVATGSLHSAHEGRVAVTLSKVLVWEEQDGEEAQDEAGAFVLPPR